MKLILITSGDFIPQELQSEFGEIPPSFLPLAGKRLFNYQLDLFLNIPDKLLFLSVPHNYIIANKDLELLKNKNCNIIKVPNGLTLNKSILYCINSINEEITEIIILHGDTLFKKLELIPNSVTVKKLEDNYKWGIDRDNYFYSGFFYIKDDINIFKNLLIIKTSFEEVIIEFNNHSSLIKLENNSHYDFGHINTFYKSQSQFAEIRDFNNYSSDSRIFSKYSKDTLKISAEINWFRHFNNSIYTPKLISYNNVLSNGELSYDLEYLTLPLLSNIYLFGNLPIISWRKILLSCKEFLDYLSNFKYTDNLRNYKKLYVEKTYDRLSNIDYPLNKKIKLNGVELPSILNICKEIINGLSEIQELTAIHGDFHFGNIFYNGRNNLIKVIDPRGLDGNNTINIYGDPRYDIAKLCHSIIGQYDYIISGYNSSIIKNNTNFLEIKTNFISTNIELNNLFFSIFSKYEKLDIIRITILLFFSMIPLHSNSLEKQNTILATAIKLYYDYIPNVWREF